MTKRKAEQTRKTLEEDDQWYYEEEENRSYRVRIAQDSFSFDSKRSPEVQVEPNQYILWEEQDYVEPLDVSNRSDEFRDDEVVTPNIGALRSSNSNSQQRKSE